MEIEPIPAPHPSHRESPAADTDFGSKWWIASPDPDERAALRERNLAMFEKKYGVIHAQLVAYQPRAELVFGEDGKPDMQFAGTRFYDGDIEGFTTRQLARYWQNPNRLALYPPQPHTLDRHAGRFLASILERMKNEAAIDFTVGRTSKNSFYGLVMGIGLGRHLPEFVEKTGCRNLFLLEPNYEGLYHSLELLDWEALLLEIQDRNGDVFFYAGGSPQNWMDWLRAQTRMTNTVSIDGIYVYSHYNNSLFQEFSKKFNKESQFLMTGLGFFYDEQIMIRNTYSNMSGRQSRIYRRAPSGTYQKIPVVIVGCGPSLDKNIEEIKRIADNAVIMSCGSALGPLLDAGIRPDFQMELENIAVMRVMKYAAERHDLSGICLVSSSTVEREIKDFFDEVVYYFRPALCPYPIFSNDPLSCLLHPDPTVVNVGLSFAQELGFREYYFFGTDLGQKDSNQHHAKSSYHYTDIAKNDIQQVFNIEVPANFGGKARTSPGLFWALDTLQRAIGYTGPQCKYYNCSNGARINRAIPKLARTLDLPPPEISRADAVKAIIETFPEMTAEEFEQHWQPEKMLDATNEMFDEILDMVEREDLISGSDHLIKLAQLFYLTQDSVYKHYASLVLRGSINQTFIAGDYYLSRINDESKYDNALHIFREEYQVFAERLLTVLTKHIRSLKLGIDLPDEYLSGDSEDDGLTDAQRDSLMSPAA